MNELVLSNGKKLDLDKMGLKPIKPSQAILKVTKIEKANEALIAILDLSGSMQDYLFGSSDRKVDILWKVLTHDLKPRLSGWTYGVIGFQGIGAWWIVRPTKDANILSLTAKPEATDSTPMLHGLTMAWDWVVLHANKARFILISDGQQTDCGDGEMIERVSRHTSVPIDTVGIGDNTFYNEKLLKDISRLTGGMFCKADDTSKLTDSIVQLAPENRPLLGQAK